MARSNDQWRSMGGQLAGACVLACLCLLIGFALWWPASYLLTYSETDDAHYRGVYAAEITSTNDTYHWTAADALLKVPRTTWAPFAIVDVKILDSARPLTLTIATHAVPIETTRRVIVLLAQPALLDTALVLRAPPLLQPDDDRHLGVRLARVDIHTVGQRLPAPLWLMMACWLVVVLSVSCRVLGLAPRVRWLVALVVPLLMMWTIHVDPSFATRWVWGWTLTWGIGVVGWVVMCRLLPQLPRTVRIVVWIWLMLRLITITYPGFEGHDYVIHAKRLLTMSEQQQWTVLDYPFEFNRRPALIVPLFYIIAGVLEPLFGTSWAMHVIAVCAEITTAVCFWVLLHRTNVSPRHATMATIVALVMPLSSAVLWWAFFPQILAHMCLFGMMASTARRDQGGAWWAGVWCAAIAWTHIGEILIAAVWYGWMRISEGDRGTSAWWWRWVPVVTIPLSALLVYVPYIQFLLNTVPSAVSPTLPQTWEQRIAQLQVAFAVGFAPIPWWLFPVLWWIIWHRIPQVARPWIVTVACWLLVELVTAYQVRYIYLAMPLVALGVSALLVPIWQRHWAGRVFVVVLVVSIAWISGAHWYDATLLGYRMRIDGLSH